MTKELEERLASLERQLAQDGGGTGRTEAKAIPHPKHRKRLILATALTATVITGASGTALYLYSRSKPANSPIPAATIRQVNFAVYYPAQVPAGYSFQAGSTTVSSSMLSYKITNGSKQIVVIEQPNPQRNLMLDSTVGLAPLDTPNGKAYTGKSKSSPAAILPTKTTLVSISGTADVAEDVINTLVRSLKPIQ